MKPKINGQGFGWIRVDGTVHRHDVILRLDGRVEQRQKHLSKALYGTSHVISLAEAQTVVDGPLPRLIIGAGLFGRVRLSDEAARFFAERDCLVELMPTPQAVRTWNDATGPVSALLHITC